MKTVVIGGGPSGMIAAYFRAAGGDETTLIERNEKLGKKLYITGKGRCNVTNSCTAEEFLSGVVTNPKFLAGAIRRFTPEDFKEFIERKTPLKVERGNRVFPESDKASDITKCLESYMREAGVSVRLSERVVKIEISNGKVAGVVTDKGRIPCDEAIVCTGGVSYPSTGSTGDGYAFAREAGHTVVSPKAALVGIDLAGDKYKSLQGVSLKNIRITAFSGVKKVFEDFGEMAFTHFGISGPVVLSASSYLNKCDLKGVKIFVDLKPALSEETLDARVLRDFEKYKNKRVKNSLDDLLIKALVPVVIDAAGINGEIKNSEFRQSDRKKLVRAIKGLCFSPRALRPVEEAIVTSGGVAVGEVNPKTMESKLVKGLYFAGEVLDIDALTGGFNITAAACTAYAAGNKF